MASLPLISLSSSEKEGITMQENTTMSQEEQIEFLLNEELYKNNEDVVKQLEKEKERYESVAKILAGELDKHSLTTFSETKPINTNKALEKIRNAMRQSVMLCICRRNANFLDQYLQSVRKHSNSLQSLEEARQSISNRNNQLSQAVT